MVRAIRRILAFVRMHRDDEELSRELASHIAMLEESYRRRGLDDHEARAAARRALGSVALARDRHRDARSFVWVRDAAQDLRFAARLLARSPGVAAVVVLTMALSVGATTTLFSLAYGVLMRPLEWPESDRLVRVQETRGGRAARIPWTISNGTYLAWGQESSTIEAIGGWLRSRAMNVVTDAGPERLQTGSVTPSLFRVLRVQTVKGRWFVDEEAAGRQPDVVILGYRLWQRAFGGASDIVGRSVRFDDRPLTVVGVMPEGFTFPDRDTEAWTPARIVPIQPDSRTIRLMIFSAMARMRPGVTTLQAEAEATARARSAPDPRQAGIALFGGGGPAAIALVAPRDVLTAQVRPALMILLAAVALLFLASTASLVVLQLSRVARRSRETAVRAAIGAGASRLLRQRLAESVFLGAIGAVSGLLLSALLHGALPSVLPASFPRLEEVRLDWRVAAFAGGAALVTSLACGMVAALGARRRELLAALCGDGGGTTPAVSRTAAARLRSAFMAGQVAIACVLLIGGAILTRSFVGLIEADRGFDPHGLLTLRIPLPSGSTFPKWRGMLDRLQARLQALPDVELVAFGNALPYVTSGGFHGMRRALPRDPSVEVDVQTLTRAVSPEYFRAMRLRLVDGRSLTAADTESSPPVVVVNRTFAAQYLGDRPIGQRLDLRLGTLQSWQVVGIVDDMRQGSNAGEPAALFGGVADPPQAEIFFAHQQWGVPIQELIVVVRTAGGDPAALAPDVRAAIRGEGPALVVDSMMTMEERVAASLEGARAYAVFLAAFALCALAIAGVGLFGVLSFTTVQRTREIGLRTALGAQRADVLNLVLRQAMLVTLAGVGLGLAAAFFLVRAMSALVYGVSTHDAVSFVAVPLVLVGVSLLACAAPAWRAMRINPLDALRTE